MSRINHRRRRRKKRAEILIQETNIQYRESTNPKKVCGVFLWVRGTNKIGNKKERKDNHYQE